MDTLINLRRLMPGVAIASTVAAAASFVSVTYGGPIMLMALLIGMALHFLSDDERCREGIRFTSRFVLRVGVALLGLRITLSDISSLGVMTIEMIIAGAICTILSALLLARLLGTSGRLGFLIGGATAICGASAALALSSVLLRTPDAERETAFTIVCVTALSTLAMIIYPAVFHALGLDDRQIGILLGATIHDVAQVVGASYSISDIAGEAGTVVKLFRVGLLIPLIVGVLVMARFRGEKEQTIWSQIPWFLIAFAGFVLLNALVPLPEHLRAVLSSFSQGCLVAAVAAIGVSTSLEKVMTVGHRPLVIACGATLVLGAVSIAMMMFS